MSVKLISIDKDYAKHIEYASRASSNTESTDTPEELVKKLVKLNHLSIGRYSHAMFQVECSLVASHQICRHPFLSIVQRSFRYTEFKNDDEFVIPEDIKNNPQAKVYFKNVLMKNREAYEELIGMGIKKEFARYVLPTATQTRLVISSNFQGWLDVCSLRCDKHTQLETRLIFQDIFNILCQEAPAFFEYFRLKSGRCKKKTWEKDKEENLK